jgi:hypothetical protein
MEVTGAPFAYRPNRGTGSEWASDVLRKGAKVTAGARKLDSHGTCIAEQSRVTNNWESTKNETVFRTGSFHGGLPAGDSLRVGWDEPGH